jgi:hypothetical protein
MLCTYSRLLQTAGREVEALTGTNFPCRFQSFQDIGPGIAESFMSHACCLAALISMSIFEAD